MPNKSQTNIIVTWVRRRLLNWRRLKFAFWFIMFRTVPLHVYTDMCTREAQLADAVTQLTARVGILIDRGER
jgi:hypothetical protein